MQASWQATPTLTVTRSHTGDAGWGSAAAATAARTRSATCSAPARSGLRQHHGKLLASVPGNQVAGAKALVDRFGYALQAFVAGLMTLAVVVELEMIYITDEERDGLLHANVTAPLLRQVLVEAAPIGDLRKAIDACFFAFLGRIVTLVDEDLDQDFEISLLAWRWPE